MAKYSYNRFDLDEGPIELWLPKALTKQDVEDLVVWMRLILNRIKRSIIVDDYSI